MSKFASVGLFILLLVILIGIAGYYFTKPIEPKKSIEQTSTKTAITEDGIDISPISHATMVLQIGGQTICVDPEGGPEAFSGKPAPQLILVTDIHGDHLNPETIQAVA